MSIRPTFFGLEIAKTGLYVSQKGLDVTGHNVANADTLGYTRQRIVNTAYDPYGAVTQFRPVSQALVGSGARVTVLDQLRSQFLDRQFRTEQTQYSQWATRTQGLTYIEALFENADSSATLNSVLDALFEGFNTEGKDTSDQQQRTYLKQQALKVCEQLNHMYDQLIDQQKDQNMAVETVVNRINTIADRIAVLNKSIYSFEMAGQPANDLRDQRNLLLDELSALVDIEYSGDAVGSKFELKVGGKVLVSHVDTNHLAIKKEDNVLGAETDGFAPRYTVCWASDDPNPDNWELLNVNGMRGGELKGHLNLRDNMADDTPGIPYFIAKLNQLVQTLVQTINSQHREGWTNPSSGQPSQQGVNFFYEEMLLDAMGDPVLDGDGNPIYTVNNITAGNIRLSQEIIDSVFNIASSSSEITFDPDDPDKAQTGNNFNMLAIFAVSAMQDLALNLDPDGSLGLAKIGIGSFGGFISSLTLDVAITLDHSKQMTKTQSTLLLSADTQRTSISGVSLDEEMTNLIRYNHAYSGASRVITTMDEALDVLINRMGRVGL